MKCSPPSTSPPTTFLYYSRKHTGATIIPSPTVEHTLSEELHKINGTSSSDDRGQEDGRSTTTMSAPRAAVAAATNIVVNEQLTAAESAVAQAASHLELMRELAGQALVIADEASHTRTIAHKTLAAARRVYTAAIDKHRCRHGRRIAMRTQRDDANQRTSTVANLLRKTARQRDQHAVSSILRACFGQHARPLHREGHAAAALAVAAAALEAETSALAAAAAALRAAAAAAAMSSPPVRTFRGTYPAR